MLPRTILFILGSVMNCHELVVSDCFLTLDSDSFVRDISLCRSSIGLPRNIWRRIAMLERTLRVLTILLSNLLTRTTGIPLILTPALPQTVRSRVVAKLSDIPGFVKIDSP